LNADLTHVLRLAPLSPPGEGEIAARDRCPGPELLPADRDLGARRRLAPAPPPRPPPPPPPPLRPVGPPARPGAAPARGRPGRLAFALRGSRARRIHDQLTPPGGRRPAR